ncbi:MAG TPA: galactokinase [Saprospiraceae bacterium]|nr:galactokinase [Saprospiraceae bacterium]
MYPESVIQSFRQIFGTEPAIVVRAPGRINIIGEHTDYNEGFVLPAAIDKAIWFAASPRSDDDLHFQALDFKKTYLGTLKNIKKQHLGWYNYLLGTFSELQKDGHHPGGVNVAFGGNIPTGAGLSSSAAVESGMLFVLNEMFGLGLDRPALARLAQRAENNFVGMNCGIMDMFASLMGRAQHAMKLDCRSLEVGYYPVYLPDHTFVLCDSGVKHQLVDSEYNTRRRECEEGVAALKTVFPDIRSLRDVNTEMLASEKKRLREVVFQRCLFVVEENERVHATCNALENNDLPLLGKLLYQSHEGLRLQYEVTCSETDILVENALSDPAAAGARQMGGGFGGCTLNLVRRDAVPDFQEKMQALYSEQLNRRLICYPVEITNGVEVFNR